LEAVFLSALLFFVENDTQAYQQQVKSLPTFSMFPFSTFPNLTAVINQIQHDIASSLVSQFSNFQLTKSK